MYETSPVNPALANLLQVASMVTPDQTPTVAAQVAGAAEQMMAPQMPQGMPQGMPQQPGMQDIMQQAGTGAQIQQMQQQEQQQAMMQMLQQQQARENAMRFGVAAAPGAETIRMAEGGIVGYAAGNPEPHPLNDPEELKKVRERLARRAYEEFRQRAGSAAEAPASRGIMSALGRMLPAAAGVGAAVADPQGTTRSLLEVLPMLKMFNIGMGDPARVTESPSEGKWGGRGTMADDPRIAAMRESMADVSPEDMEVARQAPPQQRPPAGPGGPGVPAAAAQPMGPSQVDRFLGEARTVLGQMETGLPSGADTGRRAAETSAAMDDYLRSRGVDPDQYKRDLAESDTRRQRKLEGIESLAREREQSRSGIDGLIRLLSAAGGRTDPLTAIGAQYGNIVAERLSDNERFMNARERVMDLEDNLQASIREKRRAEAAGQFDKARAEQTKEVELRNKQREAQINMAVETAKLLSDKEEKGLSRALQERLDMMKIQAQRESTAAQVGATGEARRASTLNAIMRDEERLIAKQDEQLQKAMQTIGIFPGVAPNKEQQQQIMRLTAERDANVARIRNAAAESRALLMGGTGGSGIKVERDSK